MSRRIIVASHNENKLKELKHILTTSSLDYNVISCKELGIDVSLAEETADSFEGNSLIKARYVFDKIDNLSKKDYVLADDSGLCVVGLKGEPGVHSSRFMGEDTSYKIKNNKIIELLKDCDNKAAYFMCTIVLKSGEGKEYSFSGKIDGEIADKPSGENGFGYDPIFYIREYGKTAADLSEEMKNSISHRGRALKLAVDFLKKEA